MIAFSVTYNACYIAFSLRKTIVWVMTVVRMTDFKENCKQA